MIKQNKDLSNAIRFLSIDAVEKANSGHPGMPMGMADVTTILFKHFLRFDPKNPTWLNRDRFILSNGHISPVYYSTLARSGYFDIKELGTFRKINSRLQGHPTNHDDLPGVNISSGSLGQGLSVGLGIALSKKLNNDNSLVYVLTGDGELQEGQNWEAFMYASANKVDNIIILKKIYAS